jgi:ribosomal protein S18 acetylase RimI-like enzyme
MITLRSAVPADQSQLFGLVATIDNFSPEEQELAQEVIHAGLGSEQNDYHILVTVDRDRKLAGFICYGPIPISVQRWDLYWIAVPPHQSRRGIGTLLLRGMEEKLGPGERVYVDTSSTAGYLKARSFYEQHGYHVASVLPDFYRVGDDKIVYCKDL